MTMRVVVTGLGIISPIGKGIDKFWTALRKGKTSVNKITHFDASGYRTRIAAEISSKVLEEKSCLHMPRFCCFALLAAAEAIKDAQLKPAQIKPERVGVLMGTSRGGISVMENFQDYGYLPPASSTNSNSMHANLSFMYCFPHAAAAEIARMSGARGPSGTVMAACASGSIVIGNAFRTLQRGEADIIIAGGTEAPLSPLVFAGTCASRAMSTRNGNPRQASRPFDKNRDGYVMGEGAGIVIMETLAHAQKRGAKIYGEVTGYGLTSDGYHITAPDPKGDGNVRAIKMALAEGKVSPAQIDYLNAHGTSTLLNDRCETLIIKRVFGTHAYRLPISSIKSMTGHLLGASGAVEFIACLLAMKNDTIPPTINYETPDPECDLDFVPNQARRAKLRLVISNSLGFGGHNACLLVKKFTN